jgi:hypothetical protein
MLPGPAAGAMGPGGPGPAARRTPRATDSGHGGIISDGDSIMPLTAASTMTVGRGTQAEPPPRDKFQLEFVGPAPRYSPRPPAAAAAAR